MTKKVVQFKQVSKDYGQQVVLSDVDLVVQHGEFLGLVGVNGAGKTTMIKCLLDFTRANGGTIEIFETDSTKIAARQKLAYLPEKFIAPYYLTGKEFLEYMLHLHGTPYSQEKVVEMAGVLDLDVAVLDKEARKYSKGMSQKLGLAACLLSNKDLLIMDEPMSGLDPRARAYLKEHLMELKQQNKTLLFSTHLLNDVEKLCDNVAILHEGHIRFFGSPAECCDHFKSANFEQAYLQCVGAGEIQ